MKLTKRLAVALAATLGSTPAVAEEGPDAALAVPDHLGAAAQFVLPFFEDLDCENVGHVQPGEADKHMPLVFGSLDRDSSRYIDRKELLDYPYIVDKQLLALSFDTADTNGDARLDMLELNRYLKTAVQLLDANGDDEVYRDELRHNLRPASRLAVTSSPVHSVPHPLSRHR